MRIKRFFLAIAFLVTAWATGAAYEYPYMNFVGNDGTMRTLSVNEMTFEFTGGNMVVTNVDGMHTFALDEMQKMYFTDMAGLSQLWNDVDEGVDVFSEAGANLGHFENTRQALQSLKDGVYVIKSKTRTLKIAMP